MNREKIISYALKYDGDYNAITRAVKMNEEVEILNHPNCITIFDKEYPNEFTMLKNPPYVLFYKGNIGLLKEEMKIGVVGSRRPKEYSLKATRDLVINNNDKVIVSGLAKGIDRQAHLYALKSIGILACGIDYIYPYENKELIENMSKRQLVISEYPGKVKPLAYHFPFRNRLIAALSETLYIMELKEKSGTMTSINEALELGIEVKVLPFDIYESYDVYNNQLINEGSSIIDTKEIFSKIS